SNAGGWYWYAEDIKVKTLWDAATDAGLVTSSVDWPVTVGARIKWNIPQVWRASSGDDAKRARRLSTAGRLPGAGGRGGPWAAGGVVGRVPGDGQGARFDRSVIEPRRPDLHLAYLASLDEVEHDHGPGSPEALEALEVLDGLVGEIRRAAQARGRAYFAIVSD